MNFLVDAQLPPRLASWLVARGHAAVHVAALPDGLRMPDAAIWAHATREDSIIVTKDRDFLDLAAVYGTPPLVLFLAIGNASTVALLDHLTVAWDRVAEEFGSRDAGVVTVERTHVIVLRRSSSTLSR